MTHTEMHRDVLIPLILGMITFSVLLVFIRYKMSTLARPHHFLALFALGRVPTQQDISSLWQGPESDPPPDYMAAVNMPSPVHADDNAEQSGQSAENINSPTNVASVFIVEIPDSEETFSENNVTEDQVRNVEALVSTGRISSRDDEDKETDEVQFHISQGYTNETFQEEDTGHQERRSSNSNDSVFSHNEEEHEHVSRIAVFDLHRMEYNPDYPQPVLPTYDEYIKDFTCVHL